MIDKQPIEFDEDCRNLVEDLLRAHARSNSNYAVYSSISAKLNFDVANRALRIMGAALVLPEKIAEKEK